MLNFFEIIKSQPAYFKQLNCNDLLFTQYDCPQIERKESFFNECNYIAYVISGRRIFHRHGKSWELTEGKSVFVKRGAHIAEKLDGEGWCVMVFFIPDDYLQQLLKENRASLPLKNLPPSSNEYLIEIDVNKITEGFYYSMVPYFIQEPPPESTLLDLKFRELVLSILLNPANRVLLSHFNSINDHSNSCLKEVMNANYMFNLSLEHYAKLANRSLATFKRDFVKLYKTTPGKWVKEQRLLLASDILTSSTSSIQNIAYDCGFDNAAHFSRAFKEQFGVSPLRYRNSPNTSSAGEIDTHR